jgi:hypothetical protein
MTRSRPQTGLSANDGDRGIHPSSAWALVLFLLGVVAGFSSLPVLLSARAVDYARDVTPPPALQVDKLPPGMWPVPELRYARPEAPPRVLPPERALAAEDLARFVQGNASPEECARRDDDGARVGDGLSDSDCAYASVSQRGQTRDERMEEVQRILASRDVQAELLEGWHAVQTA